MDVLSEYIIYTLLIYQWFRLRKIELDKAVNFYYIGINHDTSHHLFMGGIPSGFRVMISPVIRYPNCRGSIPCVLAMQRYRLFNLLFLFLSTACLSQNVQIKDGWHFVDDRKFFVKGIGYETHTRPGQLSWIYSFDADLIRFDLNRIRDAGFNTIRTWGALTEEELKLVEASGLKIIFGIWIDPNGDFSSSAFRTAAYNHVNQVLNYTRGYQSIIGYLIMNEPLVEHIHEEGAATLVDLWRSIINLIHQKHPGIPVSFSNTIVGDFINMHLFDLAAFNAYIYNPVTITYSHGYAGYLRYLKEHRSADMPFIITEFGLSVSPGTPGTTYGYGGNTLEQQKTGNLLMYRGLIDAGAQGGCVFQYHDGWWKDEAGNQYTHDPGAEEWFGLFEFSGLSDKYGSPRPVWPAFQEYNRAIIVNPKNENIYRDVIPIELFTGSEVSSYTISRANKILLTETIAEGHHESTLSISQSEDIKDYTLIFKFYNSNQELLKTETLSILCSKIDVELPAIDLMVIPDDLIPGGNHTVNMAVTTNSFFTVVNSTIDYVFHPHIGFDAGLYKSKTMKFRNNKWSAVDYFNVPRDSRVATFGAGFTIQFGAFFRRIYAQKILMAGDWADAIAASELVSSVQAPDIGDEDHLPGIELFQNYPNPFNAATTFRFHLPDAGSIRFKIYDIVGREIETLDRTYATEGVKEIPWNFNDVSSGIYIYELNVYKTSLRKKFMIIQ